MSIQKTLTNFFLPHLKSKAYSTSTHSYAAIPSRRRAADIQGPKPSSPRKNKLKTNNKLRTTTATQGTPLISASPMLPPPPPPPTCHLSRLPRELRLQIYHLLFPDQPIPADGRPAGRLGSSLRRDGAPTSAAVLRLNRAYYAEALPVLYSRAPLHVHLSRAGARMLCGHVNVAVAGGGRDRDARIAESALPHVRRVDVRVTAALQPRRVALEAAVAQTALFAALVAERAGALRELRVAVEWVNGGAVGGGELAFPTVEMARRVVAPFVEVGRRWRAGGERREVVVVVVGRLGRPRWGVGGKKEGGVVVEEEGFEEVKNELRSAFLEELEEGEKQGEDRGVVMEVVCN